MKKNIKLICVKKLRKNFETQSMKNEEYESFFFEKFFYININK